MSFPNLRQFFYDSKVAQGAVALIFTATVFFFIGVAYEAKEQRTVNKYGDTRGANNQISASGEAKCHLMFADPVGAYEVTVHRVLLGKSVIDRNVYTDFQLNDEHGRGKELIYFEVSVKNCTDETHCITQDDFTLRDTTVLLTHTNRH